MPGEQAPRRIHHEGLRGGRSTVGRWFPLTVTAVLLCLQAHLFSLVFLPLLCGTAAEALRAEWLGVKSFPFSPSLPWVPFPEPGFTWWKLLVGTGEFVSVVVYPNINMEL